MVLPDAGYASTTSVKLQTLQVEIVGPVECKQQSTLVDLAAAFICFYILMRIAGLK